MLCMHTKVDAIVENELSEVDQLVFNQESQPQEREQKVQTVPGN